MIKVKYIALVLISIAFYGCGGDSTDGTTSGIGSNYTSEDIVSRDVINIGKDMVKELCQKQEEFTFKDLIVKEVSRDTTCATYEALNPSVSCLFIDENEVYAMNDIDGSSLGPLVTCVLAYNHY